MKYLMTCLFGVMLVLSASSVYGVIVLQSYDDSATPAGYTWGADGISAKFTMSSGGPYLLTQFEVRILATQAEPTPIDLKVWADSSGQPGAELYSESISDLVSYDADGGQAWNTFDISAAGIQVNAGESVFVGYIDPLDNMDISPWFSDAPYVGASYKYSDFTGNWTLQGGDDYHMRLTAAPVPEPSTLAIWGVLGGLGLIAARRRRKQVA